MTRQRPRSLRGASQSVSKDRLRLWLRLLKTTRYIESELRERLRVYHETTLPRFDVLAALARSPEGLKMSALSSELMVSNGNVTGIVDRLADDGYLVRVPVEGDRRATLVRLTVKGRENFAALATEHEGWVNELLDGLGSEDIAALSRLLEDVQELSTIEKMK